MEFHELVGKNRSYRRFHQDETVERATLEYLVGLARLTPSWMNKQPLKYFLSCDERTNGAILECLKWAGYLKDWNGPPESERPTAYIVIIGDRTIERNVVCDHGIAAQTMLLGATERGLGGCIIGTVNRTNLASHLKLSFDQEILLVLALGKPKESVVVEDLDAVGDVKYWRDVNEVHHVPKRTLDEIIVN